MWLGDRYLVDNFNAHRSGSAGYGLDAAFFVDCVQEILLCFGDFCQLCAADFANLIAMWLTAPLLDTGLFADHIIHWLAQALPCKGAVFEPLAYVR